MSEAPARIESWTRDGQTATIEVQPGNTVVITYELLAQLLTEQGYQCGGQDPRCQQQSPRVEPRERPVDPGRERPAQ